MFPLTITITNTDQLMRVMLALNLIETTHPVTTGVTANEKAALLQAAETALADTVDTPPAPVAEAPGKLSAAPTAPSPRTAEAAPSTSGPSPAASATSATPSAQPTAPAADAPSAGEPFEYATLQKAVNTRIAKFGKDALLAIAKKHGADTFKGLAADKWAAAHADVVALGE